MFRFGLCILLGLVLILDSCSDDNNQDDSNISMTAYEKEIFDLINRYRQENGKNLLVWSAQVQIISTQHNSNMAEGLVRFGHDGFERRASALSESIKARLIAENVARGQRSALEVVRGWLNSPGHKKNIDGEFLYASLSAQKNQSGEWYYTQIFCNL